MDRFKMRRAVRHWRALIVLAVVVQGNIVHDIACANGASLGAQYFG